MTNTLKTTTLLAALKRPALFLVAMLFAAVSAADAQMKYVAVVETELDAQSGASAKMNKAEVRQITAELRSVAVKNLPRDKYNIMTSETVMSQGTARLEECAEENCVIALGSKIGADFIVRGVISKFGTSLTLSVEMYETVDGNLVATSGLIRSENTAELLDKAAAACAEMYRTFAATQRPAPKTPAAPVNYTVAVAANPPAGGAVSRNPNQTYYIAGSNVNVMAVPAKDYKFTGWSGDAEGDANPITVKIDDDKTLTANFQYVPRAYTLLSYVYPPGGGYVVRNPDKEAYTAGETVTVTAIAYMGYAFTDWSGAAAGRANRVTVAMDGNKTLTANFYKQIAPPPAAPEPPPQAAAQETTAPRTAGSRGDYETSPGRAPTTGFSLGMFHNESDKYGGRQDHTLYQIGVAHSRPITEKIVSLSLEGNIWTGYGHYDNGISANPEFSDNFGFFGFNLPLTLLFQLSVFSLETGVHGDMLFGGGETLFNAGITVGAGVGFSKTRSRRYFYRYNSGSGFGAHVVGMRWLF